MRVQEILRLLISTKNSGQFKKLPWDKFAKKKIKFHKIFCSIQIFLELQYLVDDLIDFLEWLKLLLELELLMKWIGDLKHFGAKTVCYIQFVSFFLKNRYGRLNLITCSYTCREQILYQKDGYM